MKKLNKKGFVLVETLIVTVFVVALFIVIYQATVPALGELEQQNRYDDIDSVYYSNIYKKLINRYANTSLIDTYLTDSTHDYYMDITDCNVKVNDSYVYNNREYCEFVKSNIGMGSNDKVLVTSYNITNFRNKAKTLDYFDTGILSNFRDYLQTVPSVEHFYEKKKNDSVVDGKYRLFFIREVKETDGSLTMRFANIGVYSGRYENYFQGELVKFDPGDGEKDFYVLHDSSSTENVVTLILANNLILSANPYFNCTGKFVVPDQEHSPLIPAYRTDIEIDNRCSTVEVPSIIAALAIQADPKEYAHAVDNTNTLLVDFKNATDAWVNTLPINPNSYVASAGYTIDYSNFKARLLNVNDIKELLRCSDNSEEKCFEVDNAYTVTLDSNILAWLFNGLIGDSGYWTAESVTGSNMYAWAIRNGRIDPVIISDHTNIGIRPVIEVSKDSPLLKRTH